MQTGTRRKPTVGWFDSLQGHAIDAVFAAAVIAWLWYARRVSRGLYFWSDDLPVIRQAGAWDHLFTAYNGALSTMSLLIDRAAAEIGHLSFTPFTIAGSLSLVSVPVGYYITTRRRLGPPLAALAAMPLLWAQGMNLRPAGLNHYLALASGVLCAALLNRGRRADLVLAAALLFSLASAGGGLVVVGACLVHSILVRPPLRRWLAILVPLALYGLWWISAKPATTTPYPPSLSQSVRLVRDLVLAPFYEIGFHVWPIAALLVIGFLGWGLVQLRGGRVAGANFVAWTAAMVAWAISLVQSRGLLATAGTFRYAYVAMGFALLAIVPRAPIRWPATLAMTNRRWVAVALVIVVAFAGVRAERARSGFRAYARLYNELGRKARGTMYVLRLGPGVIADRTPIVFFSVGYPHGTAGQLRRLMSRYGASFHANTHTIDETLVNERIVEISKLGVRQEPNCPPLTAPVEVAPTSFRENDLGAPVPGITQGAPGPLGWVLWSPKDLTIDVRRFGDHWVRLRRVPAQTEVVLTLPVLNVATPWKIRADGACIVPYGSTFGNR